MKLMDGKYETIVRSTLIELPDANGVKNKIHVRSAGKRSIPQEPIVVIVCGLGSNCLSFTVVQHELAVAGIPSFTYDRLGIGRSSPLSLIDGVHGDETVRSRPRYAEELAEELHEVLRVADVRPPYIIVSHSYGGVISWEWIAAHSKHIVGLVAIDANSARSPERSVSDQDLEVLTKDLPDGAFDYHEIVGLNAANRLSTALWEEAISKRLPTKPWLHGIGGEVAETQGCFDSCKSLYRHALLDRHPLSKYPVTVIKGNTETDIERMIDASEALGGATKMDCDDLRKRLEGYSQLEADQQRDHLELTGFGTKRYVEASMSGHWVHITEPDLVISEILRMFEELTHRIGGHRC